MSVKVDLLNGIKQVNETISSTELIEDSNIVIFDDLAKDIEQFKVYLPLVGNFNAGKSSILNTLLEEDELFPTDIVPETAIATEILFSTDERVEAYNFENDKLIDSFDSLVELKDRDIEKYGYLKVYKNKEFLSKNQDIILVDMPGLDSNIERHNSQILNYVKKDGISFIAVIDIDDGVIKDTTLRFIEEINSYKLDFFVLINKIDKKTLSEVTKIQESIFNQLSRYTDTPFIGLVSTFDEKLDDVRYIIKNINKDNYLKKSFIDKLSFNIYKLIQDLRVRRSSIQMDTSEIDKRIEEFLDGVKELDKTLSFEKNRIENEFSTHTIVKIQDEIKISLDNNLDRLLNALQTSEENFKATVNDVIRPIIIKSLQEYTEEEFAITIGHLEVSTSDIFSDISEFFDKSMTTLTAVGEVVKEAPLLLKIPMLANILNFVLTKVNPLVLSISAVVAVINAYFGKSKEEKEQEAYEQMRENIKNNVIPNIIIQLQETIEELLDNTKEEFFKAIEESIEVQKNELLNSIEKAKEEKEMYKDKINKKLEEFNQVIETLETNREFFDKLK